MRKIDLRATVYLNIANFRFRIVVVDFNYSLLYKDIDEKSLPDCST
ncbi:hypothetical protein QE439_002585 [Pedobacter agri]|nr:hypothetical protein [Pedobacter agri]